MDYYYLDTYYTEAVVSVNGLIRAGEGSVPLCPGTGTNTKFPTNDLDYNDNLIAPFWADLDLSGGGELYGAIILWNGAAHTVIEWENALVKETGQRVSFQTLDPGWRRQYLVLLPVRVRTRPWARATPRHPSARRMPPATKG